MGTEGSASVIQIPEDLKECYEACQAAEAAGCGEDSVDARTEMILIERIAILTFERDESRAASRQSLKQWKEAVAERDTLQLQRDAATKAWEILGTSNARLEARCQRLEMPVSDEEIFEHRSHATNGGFGHKDGLLNKAAITALIAARTK